MNTVQVLNQLLALHANSLPMYIASAPPHRQLGDERAWEVLGHIVDDQKMMVDKIADLVESLGGTPDTGEFPMEFTAFHDLSMDFLLQKSLKLQKQEVAMMEQLSGQLEPGSPAKALAQESLGAAKAHVQSLEECLSAVA